MSPRKSPEAALLRSLILPVFLPSFLLTVGEGAVVPFIVLAARDMGASIPQAGAIFALTGVAQIIFDLPAGSLVGRIGERRAMGVATIILLVGLSMCVWGTSLVLFGVGVFLLGAGWSIWRLARLSYMTDAVPIHIRGRAISTLGGIQRSGRFVGPLLAAGALQFVGLDGAFYLHMIVAVIAWVVLSGTQDPPRPEGHTDDPDGHSYIVLARRHAQVLLTAGMAVVIVGAIRASRDVMIPLWADHIGLDPAAVGLIVALAAGIDMTLFYPAGAIMDRWGRKFIMIPSLLVMATCFMLIPLTSTFGSLLAVAMVLGFGNGVGSGIIMTMGSDFAPVNGRAEFLGVWRLLSDLGQTAGPLLLSGIGGAATLGVAPVVIGLLGFGGALFIGVRVPEMLVRP